MAVEGRSPSLTSVHRVVFNPPLTLTDKALVTVIVGSKLICDVRVNWQAEGEDRPLAFSALYTDSAAV